MNLDKHEPEYSSLLSEEDGNEILRERRNVLRASSPFRSKFGVAILGTLFLSLMMNSYVIFQQRILNRAEAHKLMHHDNRSLYARLEKNTLIPWRMMSDFFTDNPADADKTWEDFNIDAGVVALSDEFVAEKGLPHAQRFPWDDTKGLYMLAGFHDMHCLKVIREWVNEADRGLEHSEEVEHLYHCIDAIRQDILCYADDTPRYLDHKHVTGIGQERQCRSWGQLEDWAKQYPGCFMYRGSDLEHDMGGAERYSYCPRDSEHYEAAKAAFPHSDLEVNHTPHGEAEPHSHHETIGDSHHESTEGKKGY